MYLKENMTKKNSGSILKTLFRINFLLKEQSKKSIKGGFEVSLGHNIRAFLPISKTDVVKVEDPEKYINIKSDFLIERLYSEKKVNIVLNRRKYLADIQNKKKDEFFENAAVGDEIEGTVKSIASFGAFIDLGGFDGLLHINDMSWGHVARPKDYVKKDQKIKLKLINN